ncbi:hypothetical protein ROHU_008305 [Labeo rohita]|uniref:Uncharacterized protein n=1 Tax=Labeo rohita TaxID=84645 RepID=A0A498M7R3_LABRO|nr:hypothetical protein ROHU_008305 [Labeo rohita]
MTGVEFKTEITRVSANSLMNVAMRNIRQDVPLLKSSHRLDLVLDWFSEDPDGKAAENITAIMTVIVQFIPAMSELIGSVTVEDISVLDISDDQFYHD